MLGLAGPPSRLPAFHTAARAPVARPSVVVAEEYSQSSRLREEVEAPFAKVRLFVWPALMAGAAIATYFAGTSLLAEAVGAREPAPDSLVNLGVDLAAVAAIGTVWRRDLQARDSRLKRLSAGAAMAALRVELGGDAAGVCSPTSGAGRTSTVNCRAASSSSPRRRRCSPRRSAPPSTRRRRRRSPPPTCSS